MSMLKYSFKVLVLPKYSTSAGMLPCVFLTGKATKIKYFQISLVGTNGAITA